MLYVTTGVLENPTVAGKKPTTTVTVKVHNAGLINDSVQIIGFYLDGTTMVQYVNEVNSLAAGQVLTKSYFAQFDSFEFQFMTIEDSMQISVWGKDAGGNLNPAHRVLPAELNPIPL